MTSVSRVTREGDVAADTSAHLLVRRPSQWLNHLRAVAICVDGRQVARLESGESLDIAVSPGVHHVHARVDWAKSRVLELELAEGERCALEVASPVRGWGILVLPLLLVLPGAFLSLQRVAPLSTAGGPEALGEGG